MPVTNLRKAGPGGGQFARDGLSALRAGFDAASAACGGASCDGYDIAGARVHLRFASPALRSRLAPAFDHLAARADDGAAPALTVCLWDSASTGVDPPPRPPAPSDHAEGALFHFHEPPIRAAYQPGLESLSVWDAEDGIAWHWVSDALEQPYWDQASPIRQILFWWLSARGCLQVHGAAVGTPDGGVLLVGKGGSGKSTVALSTLGSELLYAGDDYVAVTLDPSPRIESLYGTAKLEPDHARALFPNLVPLLSNADRLDAEKAVIHVHGHFPESLTKGFPLRAILVPKVRSSQRESRIVDVSRAEAFAALAPSTIFQLHTAGPDSLAQMSGVVQRVPCYGLELGSDLAMIPATISDFLGSLDSA